MRGQYARVLRCGVHREEASAGLGSVVSRAAPAHAPGPSLRQGLRLSSSSRRRAEESAEGVGGWSRGGLFRVVIMAIDWIGFCYAAVVALGGVVGYTRKGSIVSLAAGLFFGLVSGYGAFCVTHDSRDVKISFFSAFILTIVMGMRFKRSKKLIPGGLIAGLSLLMILRLVFLLL
ncbi:transmembrane protein 14A isoform X1 [Lepidochelys kempii]|uniref:transmembrane protein 14A isoform X1 n=2 Tax=Lepidochelys kempii TaxID=8472 RepID=UPI003C6EEF3F